MDSFKDNLGVFTDKYEEVENNSDKLVKYQSVIKLKRSSENIQLLISLSEDEAEEKQLIRMKKGVDQTLTEQLGQLKVVEQIGKIAFSLETLKQSDIGKLTKCYIQSELHWKNAEVVSVDLQQQAAVIRMFGKEVIETSTGKLVAQLTLPAYFLKVPNEQHSSHFQEGSLCKSIYSTDGEFYSCTIEKIDQQGYHVRYKKYNQKEIVKLNRLRLLKPQNKMQQYRFPDFKRLVLPGKLKIRPNDPEDIKKSKKTEVKALKFAFKNANKQRQAEWDGFTSSCLKHGCFNGYFQNKFDVSVISHNKQIKEINNKSIKKD